MTSAAAYSAASYVSFKKENDIIPSPWFSTRNTKRKLTPKVYFVMAVQQAERLPSTTGKVKTGMTMTEKILLLQARYALHLHYLVPNIYSARRS